MRRFGAALFPSFFNPRNDPPDDSVQRTAREGRN